MFSDWISVHEERKNDQLMWEMYLHKLGAWDSRSFIEFKNDVGVKPASEKELSSADIADAVKSSFNMLNSFRLTEIGG